MTIFDDAKPRTGSSEARRREREISKLLMKLMETRDERKFIAGLEKDLGITPASPNYREIISVWKEHHGSPE